MPLQFNNQFNVQLPADPDVTNQPRQVHNACFSWVKPTPVKAPLLVAYVPEMSVMLGLNEQEVNSQWFTQIFSGNQLEPEMKPYAMCYGGHQFGHWAGQLGDGRAINLAEVIDIDGNTQALQLKGAGLTPYSRTADGLAVLRSSVREFLCSEAMFHLGVPTTRALSLMLTGEQVMRDMFYDGHPEYEPGAVVCRVAPSFIRFGNFQLFAARKELKELKQLIDFTIEQHFPHLGKRPQQGFDIAVYERWFDEICRLTADMVVHWMRVGFVHGVMNTDNLSILGLTIDYGPYGWLEGYDPDWTPNTTDEQGKRYCYGNQPQIAQWNLYQLANALVSIIERTENLEQSLTEFADYYQQQSQQMYAEKLGLKNNKGESDQKLINQLMENFGLTETDMTIFFRALSHIKTTQNYTDDNLIQIISKAFYQPDNIDNKTKNKIIAWLRLYIERLKQDGINDDERMTKMNLTNPKFVLRNYLAQQAIDKATTGDFSEVKKLLNVFRSPYDEQPENELYAEKRPEWARHKAGCSMLSCSS